MASKLSKDMEKHYRSMFRKFKARIRAIEKEGLDLDIVNTAFARFEKLKIDPMQKKLTERDINILSKGTVLETFLENKLSTAAGRRKVLKTINEKVGERYDDLDKETVSRISNFLTTTSYSIAVSLGLLNSDLVAEIFDEADSDLSDLDVSYAVDEVVKRYLNGQVKQKDFFQSVIDKLDEISKM